MNSIPALFALALAAGLAVCDPQTPEQTDAAVTPPAAEVAETSTASQAPVTIDDPAAPDSWQLTPLTPAANEIYCSLRKAEAGGELLFITEIAGVPAPAAVAVNGEMVMLEQVSKDTQDGVETWIYKNDAKALGIELTLTEVNDGFESKDYEGTIQVTGPTTGTPVPVKGTCGV